MRAWMGRRACMHGWQACVSAYMVGKACVHAYMVGQACMCVCGGVCMHMHPYVCKLFIFEVSCQLYQCVANY